MSRVDNGVSWLDSQHPGWDERIDVEQLAMSTTDYCLLAQLDALDNGLAIGEGSYYTYLNDHGLSYEWGEQFGFVLPIELRAVTDAWKHHDDLQAIWERKIASRRFHSEGVQHADN